MIDITDILSAFQFGQKGLGLKNGIVVGKNPHHDVYERHEILKDYWKPTLHFKRGFCYTFEPKRDTKFPVLYHGELLSINLKLEVSSWQYSFCWYWDICNKMKRFQIFDLFLPKIGKKCQIIDFWEYTLFSVYAVSVYAVLHLCGSCE